MGGASCWAVVTMTLCPVNSDLEPRPASLKPVSGNGPRWWSCHTHSVWGLNQTREDSAAKCPNSVRCALLGKNNPGDTHTASDHRSTHGDKDTLGAVSDAKAK